MRPLQRTVMTMASVNTAMRCPMTRRGHQERHIGRWSAMPFKRVVAAAKVPDCRLDLPR